VYKLELKAGLAVEVAINYAGYLNDKVIWFGKIVLGDEKDLAWTC